MVHNADLVGIDNEYHSPKDAAHDVLAKLFVNGRLVSTELKATTDTEMRGYLRATVLNLRTDQLRKKSRSPDFEPFTDETNELYSTEDVLTGSISSIPKRQDEALQLKELVEILGNYVDDLPEKMVTVLRMTVAGAKQEDIAETLGVNVKSVGSLVSRARNYLKNELKKQEPDYFEALTAEGLLSAF